ncbi:MAG: MerR family transcriptional regulator [Deltaproteobacteria bacterium]|nr:MAG: MerR family transcriptional regulator [Deltaproteobacteria bacterium]
MPNLTIKIDDEDFVRRAKVVAAKRGTSLSALVREYLVELVKKDEEYEQARKQALSTLKRGLHLGGAPITRDEVYRDRVE